MGGGKGEEEVGAGQGSGSEKEPKGSLRQDGRGRLWASSSPECRFCSMGFASQRRWLLGASSPGAEGWTGIPMQGPRRAHPVPLLVGGCGSCCCRSPPGLSWKITAPQSQGVCSGFRNTPLVSLAAPAGSRDEHVAVLEELLLRAGWCQRLPLFPIWIGRMQRGLSPASVTLCSCSSSQCPPAPPLCVSASQLR